MSFAYYGVVLLTTEMLAVVKERSNGSSIIPCIGEWHSKETETNKQTITNEAMSKLSVHWK